MHLAAVFWIAGPYSVPTHHFLGRGGVLFHLTSFRCGHSVDNFRWQAIVLAWNHNWLEYIANCSCHDSDQCLFTTVDSPPPDAMYVHRRFGPRWHWFRHSRHITFCRSVISTHTFRHCSHYQSHFILSSSHYSQSPSRIQLSSHWFLAILSHSMHSRLNLSHPRYHRTTFSNP